MNELEAKRTLDYMYRKLRVTDAILVQMVSQAIALQTPIQIAHRYYSMSK